MKQMAKPHIDELCREIVWPMSIATLSETGTTMVLREATGHSTPLAIERYSAGFGASLFGSAAGRAHRAFCAPRVCCRRRTRAFSAPAYANARLR